MGQADYYRKGSWNCICDICGFKRKSNDVRKTWDGYWACATTCWYERNPQDFVRGVVDRQNVPWTRPDPTPTFVPDAFESGSSINGATLNGSTVN